VSGNTRTDAELQSKELSSVPSVLRNVLIYTGAVVIAFVLIALLLAVTGYNPWEGLLTMIGTSFKSPFTFWATINKFIPLILATFAFAIPFKLRIYNIGALGQMQVGGIVAVIVAFELTFLPAAILVPAALVIVMIASGLYGAVCGWFKNRFGINPIISTVMLNFISHYVLLFFTTASGYEDPFSGHPMTLPMPENSLLPIWGGFPTSLVVAILTIAAVYLLMKRTRLGYQIEASGFNQVAAGIYGINVPRLVVLTLFIGGAMAGLSGAVQVMAVQKRLIEGFAATSGAEFGTFGILTALIARGEAVAIPAAAFFMSVLLVGADGMQRTLQIPVEMVFLMQSVMVIIIVLIRKRFEPRY
jgi:simple sugar transport system permease protein